MSKKRKNRKKLVKTLNEAVENELGDELPDSDVSSLEVSSTEAIDVELKETLPICISEDMDIDPLMCVYSLPIVMSEGLKDEQEYERDYEQACDESTESEDYVEELDCEEDVCDEIDSYDDVDID